MVERHITLAEAAERLGLKDTRTLRRYLLDTCGLVLPKLGRGKASPLVPESAIRDVLRERGPTYRFMPKVLRQAAGGDRG